MRVDDDFMREVGLDEMPDDEKRAFIEHAEEEFEVRVGQSISDELTDNQLAEFEQIDDDRQAAAWIEENAPNFREHVKRVFEDFKAELLAERAAILG